MDGDHTLYVLYTRTESAVAVLIHGISVFVSESFIPTVPAVAEEFHSTGEVIKWAILACHASELELTIFHCSLAVTFSMASAAITSMIWATYSGFCTSHGTNPLPPLLKHRTRRRASTNIPRLLTTLLHRLSRRRLVQLRAVTHALARRAGRGDVERDLRRRWCSRRHIQGRGARDCNRPVHGCTCSPNEWVAGWNAECFERPPFSAQHLPRSRAA